MAKDPVCGMKVNEKEAKKKEFTLEKAGETLYFCSKDCKEKFETEPAYEPIKCEACMRECDLGKTVWKIKHKGELYCFCSEKCKEDFEKKRFGEVIY